MFRSVITVPRLNADSAPFFKGNPETVKAAVQLQVLRRKAQQIDIFRRGRQPAEAFIQIVAVLEERTAGAGGQFRQNIGAEMAAVSDPPLPLAS